MLFATRSMFLYHDKLYKQTDRVTMGLPLNPTSANFCLGILEQKNVCKGLNDPDSSQNLKILDQSRDDFETYQGSVLY